MEIPNYESGKNENENFKQLHSGSEKTNLLYHTKMTPLLYCDQIHLYVKNLEQDKYKNMMEKMNGISEHVGYDVFVCNNNDITPISDLLNTELQRVVNFKSNSLIISFKGDIKISQSYI